MSIISTEQDNYENIFVTPESMDKWFNLSISPVEKQIKEKTQKTY